MRQHLPELGLLAWLLPWSERDQLAVPILVLVWVTMGRVELQMCGCVRTRTPAKLYRSITLGLTQQPGTSIGVSFYLSMSLFLSLSNQ